VLTITSGDQMLTFDDVLVGDVYICSGQSNMEWAVGGTMNAQEEIAAANHPLLRLFDVPGHPTANLPQTQLPGGAWNVCTPKTVPGFSAVGYFFGRELQQQSGIPIGLIGSNWGGTRIEPWTSPGGFRSVPELKAIADNVDRFDLTQPAGKETWNKYFDAVDQWSKNGRAAIAEGRALPAEPREPGYTGASDPTAIYNAMIAPLVPYGIRGAIWYQGESNGGEGVEYFHKMQALINGWREVWNQEGAPIQFYFVQLANFQAPNDNPAGGDGWARIRDAQTETLTLPNTGMAVIIDIGEAGDIHPRNKQDVGKRLSLWALRDVYGKKETIVSGPHFKSLKIDGNKAIVSYDHVGGGLIVGRKEGLEPTAVDAKGRLGRFAIAGDDMQWKWGDAVIDGGTVVVTSAEVAKPVAVRYAWSMNPSGANLYNKEGLPAVPFRTDEW